MLKRRLEDLGIKKTEIYIDWQKHVECIGIQGRYQKYYMDLHIYPNEFCLSFDLDESDEDETYPMGSKEYFYQMLEKTIHNLM